ncbi:MAG TPA: hypothetical protein VMT18_06895, partial [Planctomycetota bacterium]|nr:hypothetical protein [Planctomycetota bacterium]
MNLALLQTSGEGLRETFRLADAPAAWVAVLVIAPALALVAWLAYRSEPLTGGRRALLGALRFAALGLLVLVLARPVLVQRREEVQKAEVLVLVDDSASMRRQDAYEGDDGARRALAPFAPAGPDGVGDPRSATRAELAAGALVRELLPHLENGEYQVSTFAFAGEAVPVTALDALTASGASTQLGASLVQVLGAHRGRHVTDVVVFSDGRQNGGLAASEAARAAAAGGVPVHTVVLGDTR